jgi:hypothetical protein
MPSVQRSGGMSIIRPFLTTDIDLEDENAPDFVEANWVELKAALDVAAESSEPLRGINATIELPAGKIYISAGLGSPWLQMDERHSGVTVRGAGTAATVMADPYRTSNADIVIFGGCIGNIVGGLFAETSTTVTLPVAEAVKYHDPQLLYFWKFNSGTTRTELRQRCRITDVNDSTGVITFTPALSDNWDQLRPVKGFEVSGAPEAGEDFVLLADANLAENFKVNDDVIIGDGPAIQEFYCEWVTVTDVDHQQGRISFRPPLRRSYGNDLTCMIPPPHMTDIALRDFTVAGPVSLPDELRWVGYV